MAVKTVSTFVLPDEYQRQAAEARRRRRMAELMAQQAYQPGDIQNAPIPAAAPLVQGLQAFLTARQMRKAEEAEERASAAAERAGADITGYLFGGGRKPGTVADLTEVTPAGRLTPQGTQTEADLTGVTPAGELFPTYKQDPNAALRAALTPAGGAAMKGNPLLAARLAEMLKQPEAPSVGAVSPSDYTPESLAAFRRTGNYGDLKPAIQPAAAPKTAAQDTMQWNPTTQSWEDIPGAVERIGAIAAAKRPDVVVTGGRNEPLVTVKGEDGNPILVPRSQAAGMTPYTSRAEAQEIANVERTRALEQRSIDTQNTLDTIGQLLVHPGRKAGTGASSFLGNVPGTDARGFQAQLETFKAQTFIPMVSALKGMGALSDAEGKKLSAAVGALDPAMKEAEFEKELKRVAKFLYDKARAAGLNVVMPELPGMAPAGGQGGVNRGNW